MTKEPHIVADLEHVHRFIIVVRLMIHNQDLKFQVIVYCNLCFLVSGNICFQTIDFYDSRSVRPHSFACSYGIHSRGLASYIFAMCSSI